MDAKSLKAVITRTLKGYSDKPKVYFGHDGFTTITLNGGNWQARDDVAYALRNHLDSTTNYPTKKVLRLDESVIPLEDQGEYK